MIAKKYVSRTVLVILALAVLAYAFLFFNSLSIVLWRMGFSGRDVIASFDVKDWNQNSRVVLVDSKAHFAVLKMDRNFAGLWHISPSSLHLVADKKDGGIRYSEEFYQEQPDGFYKGGVFNFTMRTHLLLAGVSRKEWKLEQIRGPANGEFQLKVKCYDDADGQIFLADAVNKKGFYTVDVENYIEQYEKEQTK